MADQSRYNALDGLRGIAALAVVFYHAILHMDPTLVARVAYRPIQEMITGRDLVTKVALLVFNGHLAVYVFFVLSGCVLTLSLNRKLPQTPTVVAAGFLLGRAARLYPPVIVCMLLFYAMGYIPVKGYPAFPFANVIENGSLTTISMHGPSSTVQAELLAAPWVLGIWLLRRTFGPVALLLGLAYATLAVETTLMVADMPSMHAYLIAFVCGMVIAEPAVRRIVADVPPAAWWGVAAALVMSRAFHLHTSHISLVVMTGLAALLVAGLIYGQRGSLASLLETQPVQALGRISFSFYLLNVPVLYLIWAFSDRWGWTRHYALEAGLMTGLLSVAMTWPLAVASERWVERPAIAAGRTITAWLARSNKGSLKLPIVEPAPTTLA